MQSIEAIRRPAPHAAPRGRGVSAEARNQQTTVTLVQPAAAGASALATAVTEELFRRHLAFDVVIDPATSPASPGLTLAAGGVSVVLDGTSSGECNTVGTDPRHQGGLAGRYLIGRGHRRVAMVCPSRDDRDAASRVEGFQEAVAGSADADPQFIVYADHQPLYGVLVRLMSDQKPTALFIADENLSVEAAYILRSMLDLRIPQDVSLLGMELPRVSQFQSPPLTTIAQPYAEIAAKAVDLLLGQIATGDGEIEHVTLPSWLIERESVAAV